MADTITLALDSDLERYLLVLRTEGESLEDVAVRLLRQAARDSASADESEQAVLTHPDISQLLRDHKQDPTQALPAGMTVGEYMSLTDEEQAALWNREMDEELDKSEHGLERDVPSTAVTMRQRRAEALPRGSDERRVRGEGRGSPNDEITR